MKVCVVGMWHLGSVTAACLASLGHDVHGYDEDEDTVASLRRGQPPVSEPGLAHLIDEQLARGTLQFSADAASALDGSEVVWIAYDTPVDEDDVADVAGVTAKIEALFPHLESNALLLISSQLIAGCTRALRVRLEQSCPGKRIEFAYSPENLRLGKAIQVFMEPDRIVVGTQTDRARDLVNRLLTPFADRILWMSIESAEMTKHALNAFLAMCVSFANEVAAICEQVGADAKEVERGLKSEKRIGPAAYLAPGAAFAGGTLARDVQYLRSLASSSNVPESLLSAIKESNDKHRGWAQRKLLARFGSLRDVRVAVLGLTYKPGTDTLRRSSSVELCRWLAEQGACVSAHDPAVVALPWELGHGLNLEKNLADALNGAQAIVIATPWPEYGSLSTASIMATAASPLVYDPNRVAERALNVPGIEYVSVGTPERHVHARLEVPNA